MLSVLLLSNFPDLLVSYRPWLQSLKDAKKQRAQTSIYTSYCGKGSRKLAK